MNCKEEKSNAINKNKFFTAKTIISGFLFTFYMYGLLFLEQVILVFVTNSSEGAYSLAGYMLCLSGTALGYFTFGIKKVKNNLHYYIGIFGLSFIIILLITNKYVILLTSFISALFYGYIGAYIHYYIAKRIGKNTNLGRIIGFSLALALVLQMLVYNLINNTYIIAVSILLAIIVIQIILIYSNKNSFELSEKTEEIKINKKSQIICPAIIISLITFIISLQDGEITRLESLGMLNVFGLVRLFYAIGAILAGFAADIKKGTFLDLFTILTAFLTIIGTLFVGNSKLCVISLGLIFLMSGFYVMYMEVTFIRISVNYSGKKSQMLAGAGRMTRSIVAAIVILPAEYLYEAFGIHALIIGSSIALMIMIAVYFIDIKTKQSQTIATIIKDTEIKTKVRFVDNFISSYNFTPREIVVCRFILQDNLITKEIADKLEISERSVQRHLTSIYNKTGVSSRNELYDSFYNP